MTLPLPLGNALAADSRRNMRARHVWQGSRSHVPFALEVAFGLCVWVAYKIADRITAHVAELRRSQRSNVW